MKKFLLCLLIVIYALVANAQHTIRLSIKTARDQMPLPGASASIAGLSTTSLSDSLGLLVFSNVPPGKYNISISHVAHQDRSLIVQVPQEDTNLIEIVLEESEDEEEEVIVTATRSSRTIANIPTRVEIISGEELTEKANMKPGDIRMLLNESTGIQTQQTSATSFNAGIRIQGLEGRYTQLLRDGFPLYSGFSGGLSILQIAPLDLRQVEVIKGSASTLYGGGAIAGLVNLVSKTPTDAKELSFLANATTAGGLDLSGFYSERYGKIGLTLFASRNSNKPFDPADIGLTAIPKFERYTINPRLFVYGRRTTADVGVTYITEDRTGGSMNYIKNGGNGFFETNNTDRVTTQLSIAHKFSDASTLQFKNSYSRFDRLIGTRTHNFDALQQSSFSELTFAKNGERYDWVFGVNVITEDLAEKSVVAAKRDYHYNTYGIFIQNVWSINKRLVLESGVRGDYVNEYGFEILPRVSLMSKLSEKLTTRIGGGFGYKTPTIFTEEAERRQFQNILPIGAALTNERSVGGNWDVNYRIQIGEVAVNINHMFFYTRLNKPLVLLNDSVTGFRFENADGHLDTKGMETNLRFILEPFKLFVGYTYTDANTRFSGEKNWMPLTARHRLNNVLMFEIEEKLKLGLEAYYFSRQQLSDGTYGKPYWITGFMAEKLWERISVYINFENFTNTRQSRFDTIYTGSIDSPEFRDIYAPVEGFVVNGGVRIRL